MGIQNEEGGKMKGLYSSDGAGKLTRTTVQPGDRVRLTVGSSPFYQLEVVIFRGKGGLLFGKGERDFVDQVEFAGGIQALDSVMKMLQGLSGLDCRCIKRSAGGHDSSEYEFVVPKQ